ncbi:hypothetical protein T484DRAFT_1777756, partial [Baffinella frigidus]
AWVSDAVKKKQIDDLRRAKARLATELMEAKRKLRERNVAPSLSREPPRTPRTPRTPRGTSKGSAGRGSGEKGGKRGGKPQGGVADVVHAPGEDDGRGGLEGGGGAGRTPRTPRMSGGAQDGWAAVADARREWQGLPSVVTWFAAVSGGARLFGGDPVSGGRVQKFPLRTSPWRAEADAAAAVRAWSVEQRRKGGARRVQQPEFEGPKGAYRNRRTLEQRLATDDTVSLAACVSKSGLWTSLLPAALGNPDVRRDQTAADNESDRGVWAGPAGAGPAPRERTERTGKRSKPRKRSPIPGGEDRIWRVSPVASGGGARAGDVSRESAGSAGGQDFEPELLIENCLRMISGLIEGQTPQKRAMGAAVARHTPPGSGASPPPARLATAGLASEEWGASM